MNQLAPKRYREQLSIRGVSGLRNENVVSFQRLSDTPQRSELIEGESHRLASYFFECEFPQAPSGPQRAAIGRPDARAFDGMLGLA